MCLRFFNACTLVFIDSFESAYVYLRNLIARFLLAMQCSAPRAMLVGL
ncbi:Uncharacterised protein [Chlamydia trachomatis]|nr:Uncharacterised protein [Chlamydia trachomatis]